MPSFESMLFHFDLITLFFLPDAVCFYPFTERSFLCLGIVSKRFRGTQMFGDLSTHLSESTLWFASHQHGRQFFVSTDASMVFLLRLWLHVTHSIYEHHSDAVEYPHAESILHDRWTQNTAVGHLECDQCGSAGSHSNRGRSIGSTGGVDLCPKAGSTRPLRSTTYSEVRCMQRRLADRNPIPF